MTAMVKKEEEFSVIRYVNFACKFVGISTWHQRTFNITVCVCKEVTAMVKKEEECSVIRYVYMCVLCMQICADVSVCACGCACVWGK